MNFYEIKKIRKRSIPQEIISFRSMDALSVRMKYGFEGFGIYIALLYQLINTPNLKYKFSDLESIEFELYLDTEKLNLIINECFQFDSNYFWSDQLIKHIESTEIKEQDLKTYIMHDGYSKLYKIGKSINPSNREKTLLGQIPLLELIMICDQNIEKEMHQLFSSKRIRGEWFKLVESDLRLLSWKGFYFL